MSKLEIITILFSCALLHVLGDTKLGGSSPIVTLLQGTVEGKTVSTDRNDVDRFIGIPYAEPPLGDLRYEPPVVSAGWGTEVLDATADMDKNLDSKMCLQIQQGRLSSTNIVGSEDCLFVNVWVGGTVDEAKKNHLPVMVWIHGGGYVMGSSWGEMLYGERLYDMQDIAAKGNVVAVSFNYRLGPLGFLSTGDDVAPGNNGMLDQLLALQWIQNNIWQFGGDVNQITLFGQGAGASSVALHMVSPESANLFHRVIMESGTALVNFAVVEDPYESTLELSENLNCPNTSTTVMMNCIKEANVDDVVTAVHVAVNGKRKTSNLNFAWGPVVNVNFLPKRPVFLMDNIASYDVLLGSNSMDGHAFAAIDFPFVNIPFVPLLDQSLARAACKIQRGMPQQVIRSVEMKYKNYSGKRDLSYNKQTMVELYTDAMFNAPLYLTAGEHVTLNSGKSTFVYLYKEQHRISILNHAPSWLEADFGSELPYVFDMPNRDTLHYSRSEQSVADLFLTYWSNFAWSGNPNSGPSQISGGIYWPEYNFDTQEYLEINEDMFDSGYNPVGATYRADYAAFWNGVVPQLWQSTYGTCYSQKGVIPPFVPIPDVKLGCDLEPTARGIISHIIKGFRLLIKLWRTLHGHFYNGEDLPQSIIPSPRLLHEQMQSRASFFPDCGAQNDYARQTMYGCVQGTTSLWKGVLISEYLGIPYANTQTQSNRFMQPQKPEAWSGIRDSTTFSKICPQYPFDSSTMDEDCLYLNLYVPVDTTIESGLVVENIYAVMIWLHGGTYMTGDGMDSFVGDVLALQGPVIIVTLNYRLGSLGFLSTENRYATGNYGLWDQNMAMQWVRDNIFYFGGDPSRVTIFGQGSGAESVQLHTLSGSSNDLNFTQAILQSGTALHLTATYPDQRTEARTLADDVGCPSNSDKDMIPCLQTIPVENLITAQSNRQFAPVVDGDFVSRDPSKTTNALSVRGWKYLMGVTSGDATTYWDEISSAESSEDFQQTISSKFGDEYGVRTDDIQLEYRNWYNADFSSDSQDIQTQMFNMFFDYRYLSPLTLIATDASETLGDVYFYEFTYYNKDTEQGSYPEWTGVSHGGELPYVWGDIVRTQESEGSNSDASLLSYEVMQYWTNFAQTGDPNVDEDDVKTSTKWKQYNIRKQENMQLDVELSLQGNQRSAQMQFWNKIMRLFEITCPIAGL